MVILFCRGRFGPFKASFLQKILVKMGQKLWPQKVIKMSVQVQRKDGGSDLRSARRRALLQEGRAFEVVPPTWTPSRSLEASMASSEVIHAEKSKYNGDFEIA